MGKVLAVCISAEKGTPKRDVKTAEFVADHGLAGDAHAGKSIRQVSLLSHQKIEDFRSKGAKVEHGDFGENLVVEGIDFGSLPLGSILECANVVLEITKIGKECHNHCSIYKLMGDCIMPREGVFAKVIKGGTVKTGDEMKVRRSYRVWALIASDKGAGGEREDLCAPIIREIAENAGFIFSGSSMLPDEKVKIEDELKRICDENLADLLFTSGGTGFSHRDCMPEATMAVAQRLVPGIAEAIRANGMAFNKRAMFSRAVSAIRGKTLIINLPGSPKAVRESLEYIIGDLHHGIEILTGKAVECAIDT
jgi:molybdenum cofactor synthesis domain-containing protein